MENIALFIIEGNNDRYFYLDTTVNGTWDGVGGGDTMHFYSCASNGTPLVGKWTLPSGADTASDNLQGFPFINPVELNGANLDVTYEVPSITGNSADDLTVEFFMADANVQEGKTYLGSDTYTAAEAWSRKTVTMPRHSSCSVMTGEK